MTSMSREELLSKIGSTGSVARAVASTLWRALDPKWQERIGGQLGVSPVPTPAAAPSPGPAPDAAPAPDPEPTVLSRLEGLRRLEPSGPIASDDPQVVEKLKAKIDYLSAYGAMMREANKHVRNKDQAKGDAALQAMGFKPGTIANLRKPDFANRIGFPDYEMSNNSGEIGRYKKRLETALKNAPPQVQQMNPSLPTNAAVTAPVSPPPAPQPPPAPPEPDASARPAEDADLEFLKGVISGVVDIGTAGLFDRFEDIGNRRADSPEIMRVLEQACEVFTQGAIGMAQSQLKGMGYMK
jgi:hypothetical protein